ncbi:PD40 domain-containing protein [Flammeovirga yaeyamensis]|uniref:PD40 domain-containing protein n=1 Tax=Flammeovirga yaeyamensis TaxID=367791 RepID=A0AAX1N974_9BACT|nr:OmpA family protein [Flammeovirga yaeyamensis]MBB3700515.1 peptidoglycan-associated lipoprotein [Flammeovirga yaeyamensis]NMF36864.1 OmpA family protein [Flammeovirga yaeyamensis]QWG02587.1 PD40 domain-containing protein [Flammeovirga yaeyamensis]
MKRLLNIIPIIFLIYSCSSPKKVAETHFDQGEYELAIHKYESLAKSTSDKKTQAEYYYRVAESYRLSNRLTDALPYYKLAKDAGYENMDMYFYYAYGLELQGNYKKSKALFERYAKEGTNRQLLRRAKDEIKHINIVDSLAKNPDPFIEITMCEKLNSDQDDYSPMFYKDELVFTSTRDTKKVYHGTGEGYSNLYKYTFDRADSCNGTVSYFDSLINHPDLHEASATFNRDGTYMIFARSNTGHHKENFKEVDLYESRFENGEWSLPTLLPISNPQSWDACPALSANGKTLYFASNRKGGYGGIDIYRSKRNVNGTWGKPRNMGPKINSRGNDMFPFIAANGKMYFASDGHPGLGGLDIFEATRKNNRINIKNMGRPFNSSGDDFGLVFLEKRFGAFTSNRHEEKGTSKDHIYFFSDKTPILKPVNYFLAGNSFVIKDTSEIALGKVNVTLKNTEGEVLEEVVSDQVGRYTFETQLKMGNDYILIATKDKYFMDSVYYTTADKEVDQEDLKDRPEKIVDYTLESEVELTKDYYDELIEEGEITLNNILYDFDDYRIRADAARELDKLVTLLQQHKNISIELGSHTDDRGSEKYNLKLSQKRAESAVNYIISRGIERDRLEAKGYGELLPVVFNAETEEEHQINRRTTITLLDEL